MPGNINIPSGNKPVNLQGFFRRVFVQQSDNFIHQQPYIQAARDRVKNILSGIEANARLAGGDARYRVVAFRDHKEQGDAWIVQDKNPFTKDATVLGQQLDALVASGGGDGPEAQIDALDAAERIEVVILITDSPPHSIGEPGDVVPASHPDGFLLRKLYFATETGYEDPTCTYVPLELMHLRDMRRGKYLELKKPTGDSGPMGRAMVGSVLHTTDRLRLADKWGDWIMDQSHRSQASANHNVTLISLVPGTDPPPDLSCMSSAVSNRRSPSVEELPDNDVPRRNLLPDDCSSLLMDDTDFHVTFNVPASAPPGFHAAAAGNARRLLSFWSQRFSVIPTPSTPSLDQLLPEETIRA
ncbi:hypothetical protein C8J57DRAFT_1225929 [Mycena rebaudengoi]|nr:hypothetical protein C8J57DRAFT_1225929 [Mycena rebaudengoi]